MGAVVCSYLSVLSAENFRICSMAGRTFLYKHGLSTDTLSPFSCQSPFEFFRRGNSYRLSTFGNPRVFGAILLSVRFTPRRETAIVEGSSHQLGLVRRGRGVGLLIGLRLELSTPALLRTSRLRAAAGQRTRA